MSKITFDGDLNQISEKQLEYVASVLENRGFGDASVVIQPVGKPGDNYTANVKRIVAIQNGKQLSMIAKIAPAFEHLRQMAKSREIFFNENLLYCKVLKKFSELEETTQIPEKDRLRFATWYGSFMEAPNEIILLEDLRESGYTMLDRFKSLTDNEIKIVLKDFAKLHSYSFALKHKELECYEDIKNSLIKLWEAYGESPEMKVYVTQMANDVSSLLEDEMYKNAVKNAFSDGIDGLVKIGQEDFKSKFNVVIQGDAWTNNLMFLVNDGKATECCMVDYQQARISNPVGDLHYMLFNCTDYDTRSLHFHSWIDFYHCELEKCLSNFGLKIDQIYPRNQLDEDLVRYSKVSLTFSIMLASVLIRESSEAAKFQAAMNEGQKFEDLMESFKVTAMGEGSIAKLQHRLKGLVDSHIELGYLNVN